MEKEPNQERERQPLKRVFLENADGTVRYLVGEQAEAWVKLMDGSLMISDVHGMLDNEAFEKLEWKNATSIEEALSAGTMDQTS